MKRRAISLIGLLFGTGFAAVGSLFLFFIMREFIATANSYTWTKVPATIQSIEIAYPQKRPGPTQRAIFELVAQYDYTYEGQRLRGTQIYRKPYTSGSYEELADKKWQMIRDEWGHAFVDPHDPRTVILEHDSLWKGWLILFPIPFIGIGVVFIVASLGFWEGKALTPRSSRVRSKEKSGPLLFFGSAFLLAGVLLLQYLCLRPFMQSRQANKWEEVPCKVIWSRVRVHEGDDGDTYSPDIFYEYSYQGKTYRSNRYSFAVGSSSGRSGKRKIVKQFPRGATATCFVDPNTPWHAVLNRNASMGWMAVMGVVGCLFSAVGGGIVWSYFARRFHD